MTRHVPDEGFTSRTILSNADAQLELVDRQLERLERVLVEVRNTESFVERRRRQRLRVPDRRLA
jgi:hypothetical protein